MVILLVHIVTYLCILTAAVGYVPVAAILHVPSDSLELK